MRNGECRGIRHSPLRIWTRSTCNTKCIMPNAGARAAASRSSRFEMSRVVVCTHRRAMWKHVWKGARARVPVCASVPRGGIYVMLYHMAVARVRGCKTHFTYIHVHVVRSPRAPEDLEELGHHAPIARVGEDWSSKEVRWSRRVVERWSN